MFEKYINYCNEMGAKRDAARKADREAHPIMYKIIDVVSIIITVIAMIAMIYSTIQWVAEKVSQIKRLIHETVIKTKFDRDRYEPIDEPVDDTDKECETFDDFIKRPDKA